MSSTNCCGRGPSNRVETYNMRPVGAGLHYSFFGFGLRNGWLAEGMDTRGADALLAQDGSETGPPEERAASRRR